MAASITVAGVTDAGAASLLPEALAAVQAAAVLCGGERHLAFFPDHPGERMVIKADLESVFRRIACENRPVAVLASGDPLWYGIGPLLVSRLGRERITFYPNLTSMQLAFARLGVSWQDAVFLSAHGRPLEGILPRALTAAKAVVLTDEVNTPAAIAAVLLAAGSPDAEVHVFEHLGGACEGHTATTLGGLVGQSFAALNLMVILRPRVARPYALGLPDEAYAHQRGLITKAEVRAVSVSRLALRQDSTVWDIGSGCGSVAIEAASLAFSGRVYALERDATQLEYLRRNKATFGAGNVTVVEGEAPDAAAGLPRPDAVFIGGSGGRLNDILANVFAALLSGGRIVLNLVSLEHLAQTLAAAQSGGWRAEVAQVTVSHSVDTAGLTRLAAQNPVFVVTLDQPGQA